MAKRHLESKIATVFNIRLLKFHKQKHSETSSKLSLRVLRQGKCPLMYSSSHRPFTHLSFHQHSCFQVLPTSSYKKVPFSSLLEVSLRINSVRLSLKTEENTKRMQLPLASCVVSNCLNKST